MLGGVKIPSFRSPAIVFLHAMSSAGVAPQMSASLNRCGVSAGIVAGNGCVGDACSPGTSLCGTGRSSIGKIASPVSRRSTNSNPVLLLWMMTGIC
jgi:hypothetical protein